MAEELSVRELEIAVAKALGWTTTYQRTSPVLAGYTVTTPAGKLLGFFDTTADAWEADCPRFLTNHSAFASVLAAMDAGGFWRIGRGGYAQSHYAEVAELQLVIGSTYQEAACRAFVAWKGQS